MKDFEVEIVDLGINGEGIGKLKDKVCFVPFSLVGEKAQVEIRKEKDNLLFCKLKEIKNKSEDRIIPKCKYFETCGGCSIQHLNYKKSLEFKTQLVKNTLRKIGSVDTEVLNTVASNGNYNYRSKNVFPIYFDGENIIVGMYEKESKKIVEIDECLLADNNINKTLKIVKEFFNQDREIKKQAKSLKFVVVQTLNNQVLLTIVANKNLGNLNNLVESLKKEFKEFGLFVNINEQKTSIILDGKLNHIYGLKTLKDRAFDIEYEISPFSFMQVNCDIKQKLYASVLGEIDKNDIVVDAYSGAGLLSCMIANKAKQVIGIEIVKPAVMNADKTKENNRITNLINICGDCKKEFYGVYKKFNPNVVVLDPPQKGVDENLIKEILKTQIGKIVYVSCNPKTLARDLKILCEGYEIVFVQPFDMFPNTCEVETMIVLKRK